jgi:hypothetical protein
LTEVFDNLQTEVIRVVGEEYGGNFGGWNLKKVGNISSRGLGVADDVLRLGENLGNVVAKVGSQGRVTSGKAQGNQVVDGNDVAAVGIEGGFGKGGK